MKISDALKNIQLLAFDTAPLIYYVENHPSYADVMQVIIERLDDGHLQAIGSFIMLTEVLIQPLRTNNQALAQKYETILLKSSGFQLIPLAEPVARRAATLRAAYKLRTPDAIHVATAIESDCDAFLTNDKGLKRVTEISILLLDELELDEA
jgi:predicted nucleic acid-binding protein